MTGTVLTIGELAARLGVPVRTVRFWSDEGLVHPPLLSGASTPTEGTEGTYTAAPPDVRRAGVPR